MSEWGIPQGSTFGGLGGCFVEGLSIIGGLVICGLLINFSVKQGNEDQKTIDGMEKVIYEPQTSGHQSNTIKITGFRAFNKYLEQENEKMRRMSEHVRNSSPEELVAEYERRSDSIQQRSGMADWVQYIR